MTTCELCQGRFKGVSGVKRHLNPWSKGVDPKPPDANHTFQNVKAYHARLEKDQPNKKRKRAWDMMELVVISIVSSQRRKYSLYKHIGTG